MSFHAPPATDTVSVLTASKLAHRFLVNCFYWPYKSLQLHTHAATWRETLAGKFLYVDLESRSAYEVNTSEHPVKRADTVRVVCLSDTHETHSFIDVPDGDLLLHCGDICFQDRGEIGSLGRLRTFNEFLGALTHKYKLVIAGNHDQILADLGQERAQHVLSNAIYLQDSAVVLEELGGLRVYGSPSSGRGGSGNRAFQYRSTELQEIWSKIPHDLDILMTHGSNRALHEEIAQKKPVVHVSGHFHEGHGARFKHHTTFINASILDAKYFPTHLPVVFDYPSK